MSPNPPKPVKARWQDYVLIALVLPLLCLPLLDGFLHLDPTKPPSENRLLAERPAPPAGLRGVQPWLAGWEAWFNDHFGFRNCLILWHNKLNWYGFKEKSTPLVLVGEDGWLFFAGDRMIDHFRGQFHWTQGDLEDWRKLLERRQAWLAARGIQYVFVIAPDKQTIYPEKLPAWLRRVAPPASEPTMLDQFVDYMKAHSRVNVVDLRPALFAAKRTAPAYQMTDFHWNGFGAYAGYRALMEQLPGRTPVPWESFVATNRLSADTDRAGNPRWGGELADMLGVPMPETNALYVLPGPTLPQCLTFLPTGKAVREMAYVKNPRLTQRAIVYQESFARYWLPFLGNHFGETDFFWQYHLDPKEIERQKPVLVISEFVESKLAIADPRQLSQMDALPTP